VSDEHELEQLRSSLKQNRRRLLLALNSANAGVWDWNLKTNEEYWDRNTEDVFGLEPGTFEGTYEGFKKRVHPEDLQELEQATEEAIENRGTFRKEFRIQTDGGEQWWLFSQGKVYSDDEGQPEKMVGITMDITEQKEVKQALQKALEEKELLLEEIHHRVKTNLQVISSMLRLQSEFVPDTNEAKKHLQETQLRIHAMGMVHEHLYSSGIPERMNVGAYIRELVQEVLSIHGSEDQNPDVQYDLEEEMQLSIGNYSPTIQIN